MRLTDLCAGGMDVPVRHRDLEIRGLACDSRDVCAGDLFVAIAGESEDGHRFTLDAVRSGAVAVVAHRGAGGGPSSRDLGVPVLRAKDTRAALGDLCKRFFGDVSGTLDVVGVTGTKGKTTTTWLLERILRGCGCRPALVGTVENRIGDRVIPSINTTPGTLDLHRWLAEHRDAGGTHGILEISSHAIHQRRTAGLRLRAAAFTNLAPEHLDYHETFEKYAETKISLFDALCEEADAVISRDDPASAAIAQRTRASVTWYGADLQDGVDHVNLSHEGLRFEWKGHVVSSRLLGYHNLLNLLAAMTLAERLGAAAGDVALAAREAVAPPGRLEDVAPESRFRVVVDYAHTDGALDAVLGALRPVTPGRLITVFGCGGDRDRSKRPRMGRVAEAGSDQVIVTSDNPRTEPPSSILDDIRTGLRRPGSAEFIVDRREAIGLGIRMAREGDTVLIAGKGHETYQDFGDHTVHFDDREIARSFLEETFLGSPA